MVTLGVDAHKRTHTVVAGRPAPSRRPRFSDRGQDSRRDGWSRQVQVQGCLRTTQRHRPKPVWSSNRARHLLSRTGNRQLNMALHRMALTQAHWHPRAKAMMQRRKANGDRGLEALRVLKPPFVRRRLPWPGAFGQELDPHVPYERTTHGDVQPVTGGTRVRGYRRTMKASCMRRRRSHVS